MMKSKKHLLAMFVVLSFEAMLCSIGRGNCPHEGELRNLYPGYRQGRIHKWTNIGVDGLVYYTADDYCHAGLDALERWQDWKFGLRLVEQSVSHLHQTPIEMQTPTETHDRLWLYHNLYYKYWNPCRFDADEYMVRMKQAGMKYLTVSAKEHDGLCLWPTQSRQRAAVKKNGKWVPYNHRYDVTVTPFKRDMIKMYVEAAHRHGMGIGLYYSHIDWRDWDFRWKQEERGVSQRNPYMDENYNQQTDPESWNLFIEKERQQIIELLTHYGKIDMLSLDVSWPRSADQEAFELVRTIRRLQPQILIRRRGIGPYGDYSTPETLIPRDENQAHAFKMPWQTIYNGSNQKTKEWLLETLIEVVSKGGNFQAGFEMNKDGSWPQDVIEKTEWLGDWLKINGEAIYATRPYEPKMWGNIGTEWFTWTNYGDWEVRAVLDVDNAGSQTFSIWLREDGTVLDTLILTKDENYIPHLQCENLNLSKSVIFEAEDYSKVIARSQIKWVKKNSLEHYSGRGYMQAMPDTGKFFPPGNFESAPEIQYELVFPEAGRYYLWARQKSPNNNSDSVYYGLNGNMMGKIHLDMSRGGPEDKHGSKFYQPYYDSPYLDRIFYTRSKNKKTVYVISLGWPEVEIVLRNLFIGKIKKVRMLGYNGKVRYSRRGSDIVIYLPAKLKDVSKRPCEHAWTFALDLTEPLK